MSRLRTYASTAIHRPHPRLTGFAIGGLTGTLLLAWIWFFVAEWGVSLPVSSAVLLAIVTGLFAGIRSGRRGPVDHRARAWKIVFIAAWTIALPGLVAMTLTSLQWLPVSAVSSWAWAFVVAALAAVVTLAPPVIVAVSLTVGSDSSTHNARPWSVTLQGAAAAFLFVPMLLAARLDVQVVSWIAAFAAVMAAGWTFFKRPDLQHEEQQEVIADAADALTLPLARRIEHGLTALLAGAAIAVVVQMSAQLMSQAAFVMFSQVAAVVSGVGCGAALSLRPAGRVASQPGSPTAAGSALLTACWISLIALAYPVLIRASLSISAHVSALWLLLPIRALLASLPLFPLAVSLGRISASASNRAGQSSRRILPEVFLWSAMGFLVVRWASIDARDAVAPIAGCGLLLALGTWFARGRPGLSRPTWGAAAATMLVALGSLFWAGTYDPARAAKLLFSTQTFLAYRDGADLEHLPFLDEGRLVADATSGGALWTVWRHRGSQLQFRENGVPRHITSLDPATCPESSSELMPTVLSLTVHPHPRRVLMIGLGGTSPLAACTEFPVQEITCVEPDPALIDLARHVVARQGTADPLSDSRVQLVHAEPELFAAVRHETYDVVLVNEGQAALLNSCSQFTKAHYARLADMLADDGLLCQRFQFVDFGPEPFREAVATLRAVFPRVVAVETAPGEFSFLACKADAPLLEPEFLARAERPQVRRVMSRLGWDWSVLLTLAALDDDALEQISATADARQTVACGGRGAFRLPAEMMRWAPKMAQVQEVLSPHHSRMANWLGELPKLRDVSQRLDDVTEQQRVISEKPDQFWAYRATLKSRLQDRPRSTIQQVAHEGLVRRLHPEDERRKEFLVALGDAARQDDPDLASIDRLLRFAEPYDPLLSFFIHGEAAHLMSRASQPRPDIELSLRLHTINFSAASDQSIQNVVAAVRLLADEPLAVRTDAERWDTLNALLNVMRERWNLRALYARDSRYTPSDVEQSLAAAKTAMARMDELAADVGVSEADWQARREVLETYLIRPLRTFRSELADRKPAETALRPVPDEISADADQADSLSPPDGE